MWKLHMELRIGFIVSSFYYKSLCSIPTALLPSLTNPFMLVMLCVNSQLVIVPLLQKARRKYYSSKIIINIFLFFHGIFK